MTTKKLYRFSKDGKFFVVDPQNTFCFECDQITYDIVEYYPDSNLTKVINTLSSKYPESEIKEVWGELEFLRVTGLILRRDKLETWVKELTTPPTLNTLTLCIDETLVSDDIRSNFILKSLLKALPQIREMSKINIQILFLLDIESLDGCKEEIKPLMNIFPSLTNGNPSISFIFPLPFQLAEDWKLSTEDKIFIHIPLEVLNKEFENFSYKVEIFPTTSDTTSIIKRLIEKNVSEIEIHFESLFISNEKFTTQQIFNQIQDLSDFYTQVLLKGKQVVINPLTDLLNRIQKGIPKKISDPAGIYQWFISPSGDIYGGYLYYLNKLGKLGSINTAEPPDKATLPLLNRGVDIVPPCINCWAKHFCGGGNPITHYHLTKKFNSPDSEWCNFQRNWVELMIAKFQELGNIDFTRVGKVHENPKEFKVGKLTILKHIFQRFLTEKLYIRPLKPHDEAILAHWENWNTATYYTFFESSVLTTNMFEKEQEILNEQKGYEEYIIIDTRNTPRGLLRIRPDKVPNIYYVWLYLHEPEDYESKSIANNFQEIIAHIREVNSSAKFLFPCLTEEEKLSTFFQKCGMSKLGTFREAVFFHKSYHDIDIYTL